MRFSLKKAGILASLFIAGLFVTGCAADGASTGSEPQKTTQYTVTFNLNGGSGTAPASIIKDSGTSITLPTTTSTKAGFKFNGWAESNNATSGTTGSYTVSKNVTLYAAWIAENAKTYKVSFMNGTTEISSTDVPENTSVTKPSDPVKENYTFVNWYSNSACTTVFNFSSKITAETKVYAKFTPTEFSITYKNADGSTISGLTPVKYTVEDTVTLPVPVKEGYTFKGWYTDSGLSTAASTSGMSGNKTFYAKWEKDTPTPPTPSGATYTLTFNYVSSIGSVVDENSYFTVASVGTNCGSAITGYSGAYKINGNCDVEFTTSGSASVEVVVVYTNTSSYSQWAIFKGTSSTATVSGTKHTNSSTADSTATSETLTLTEAGTYHIKRADSSSKEFKLLKVTVKETTGGGTTPVVSSVTLGKTSLSLVAGGSETIIATVTGTNLTEANKTVTWSTDNASVAKVENGKITAVAVGETTITATSTFDTSKTATCVVTVTGVPGPTPSSYDIDVVPGAKVTTYGWADMANSGSGMAYPNTTNIIYIGDSGYKVGTGNLVAYSGSVTKRTAFTNAIASGSPTSSSKKADAAIIIVDGIVDLSDGKISDTDHSYYDEFDSSTHKRLHGDIAFEIASNKTIIGVNGAKVAFGGLQIKASSNGTTGKNVIIRNIDFWDAHGSTEEDTKHNSSSKASADGLVIEASGASGGRYSYLAENIWVDHCKFSDGNCDDLERNYNHDGSFDIKGGVNITISYCEFTNHDKVTLFAPGDEYKFPEQRQITLHHNYYHGATQRMPRSRGCQVHIYNNVYDEIGTSKNAGYTLGPGTGSMFLVENNYFGKVQNSSSLVQYADATTDRNSEYCSKLWQSGNNVEISASNIKWDSAEKIKDASAHLTSTKPWTPAYSYSTMQTNAEAYSTVPNAAGTDKANYSKTVRVNGNAY